MDKKTLEFYNTNYEKFYRDTKDGDFKYIYEKFLKQLCGKKILDFGCGVGRDLIYFRDNGFDVEGLDGSEKLVEIARDISGSKVYLKEYSDFNFSDKYNGIWCMAGLVHETKSNMKKFLDKIFESLKNDGIVYISFKYGDFIGYIGERYFTYITEEDLNDIINFHKFNKIDLFYTKDHRDIKWMNIILKKIS